jgi:processive 1,2-diacylglycerol beta-glucosyltransferase
VLNLGRRNLGRFIRDGGYDAVLCTHVFASLMATDARKKYGLPVRAGVVETDYTATPGIQAGGLDWHFIPAESLRPELIALGVAPEKIIASGIPVRSEFYTRSEKTVARRALGLPVDCRHILLMGGSMGAGPVPELVAELVRNMNENTFVTVICGTNRNLHDQLRAVYGGDQRIRPLGYVENVSALMDASELLMTKPGGITTTEAAVKRLPMVLVNAVAGCEAHNLDFFTRIGGAVTARTPPAIAALCLDLLRDDARRAAMARALEPIARANDREVIWQIMRGRAGQD